MPQHGGDLGAHQLQHGPLALRRVQHRQARGERAGSRGAPGARRARARAGSAAADRREPGRAAPRFQARGDEQGRTGDAAASSSARPSSLESASRPARASRARSPLPRPAVSELPLASCAHCPQAMETARSPARDGAPRGRRGRRWRRRSRPGRGCRARRPPRRTARTATAQGARSARAGARRRRAWARSTRIQRSPRQRLDHAVVEHAGRVHDAAQRVLGVGIASSSACSSPAVADVAGLDAHMGAEVRKLRLQLSGARRLCAAATDEQQMTHAVRASPGAWRRARPARRCRR